MEQAQDTSTAQVSAIVIVGSQRPRAQQSITALCQQDNAHHMEIVIVDCDAESSKKLETTGDAVIIYLTPSGLMTWGELRAYAVQQSTAPIIAFLEEHTIAQVGWLTGVISAFQTHQLAVASYSFISGNTTNYIAWAGHIAEYGLWRAPASHISSRYVPWNNFAVSRSFLMSIGHDLVQILENDTAIYDHMRRTNAKHIQISDAILAHIGSDQIMPLLVGAVYGCQLLASQRVQLGNWGWLRRIAYALSVPFLVPLMRMGRLLRHYLTMPQHLWELIVALPMIALLHGIGAVSEGIGYLVTSNRASNEFLTVEIHAKRHQELDQ